MPLRLLGDHLWQSTLFAAAIALLMLAFRHNRAQIRYALWLTASFKFLVPFSALVALGTAIPWKPQTPPPVEIPYIEVASQPFSQLPLVAMPAPERDRSIDVVGTFAALVPAIWLMGTLFILARWAARWRSVLAVVRSGTVVTAGPLFDTLRRLETRVGLAPPTRSAHPTRPTRLIESAATLEPGIVGIVRPALLWPRSITTHLSDAQVEAIVLHELMHVRRRDNLTASLHMLVKAAFWFHPMVWWMGARLVDERERACDEEVLRIGGDPQVYAEGILRTCEFYLESPLVCVSGVTGSDLKKRIEAIIRHAPRLALTTPRKILIGIVGSLAVAVPVAVGFTRATPLVTAPTRALQSPSPAVAGGTPAFDAATIKRNSTADGPGIFDAPAPVVYG